MSAETGTTTHGLDILRTPDRPLAGSTIVITGTSRGIGARAAVAFARAGADRVVGTHMNPHPKRIGMQDEVLEECRTANPNGEFLSVLGDITDPAHRQSLLTAAVTSSNGQVDALVLSAAGGLERGKDPSYAMEINYRANVALLELFKPHMREGSTVIFTQSLWGHLYGEVPQEPEYEPIAASKHAFEVELLEQIAALRERGINVGILVGDVVQGTAMFNIVKLRDKARLEAEEAFVPGGRYPDPTDMADAILDMVLHPRESGYTKYVGRTREQYLAQVRSRAATE
jgi:NAD(P)-dependent dehydrogenase (short-subunit alcohol dehydrogenase family)